MGQLIQELKRRNVIRVAIAYAVSAWLLIEITATIFPILSLPRWSVTLVTVLLFIGFPIAGIFAWAFELTPEGIKLEKHVVRDESVTHVTGRKLDFVIIAMLVVLSVYFGYDKFVLDPGRDAVEIEAAVQTAREEVASVIEPQDSAKSIAVLAFADMSPEGDQEYFSDGISEEILNLLAKVPELRVTSRSSAFSFKGQNLDVPAIAARLNVAHVLEGSVRKAGNQLRITAQLIEVAADTHLWSKSYDRELKNVFAIQDEIAAAVVDALKITLLGEELKATETSPEAYTLYLQGRYFTKLLNEEAIKQAETLLKQALKIDPGFVPAWTALGKVYRQQVDPYGVRPIEEGYELARYALQRALDIDPQNGLALTTLARIEGDHTAAYQYLQQALASNPGDADILLWTGWMELTRGRLDEAIDLMQRSVALDPVAPLGHINLGIMYHYAHRLDEATDSLQMALSLNPAGIFPKYVLGLVLLAQGDAPAALVAMEQEASDAFRLTGTAIVQHALGDASASDTALKELLECCSTGAAYQLAETYAYRGEIDNALEWLEQAYDNGEGWGLLPLLDPLFANLHDDPRLELLLDRTGLPH